MKITFVAPRANLSGGARVIAIHAENLAARGHDVLVVASGWPVRSRRQKLRDRIRGRRPQSAEGSHYDGMRAGFRLLDHPGPVTDADLPDADVVIATWWETAFAVARLSPSKGRKFYFVQHHEVHSHLPAHVSAGSYHLPLRKITISEWLVETMRDTYGDTNVSLVPNSVDTSLFFAPERGRQARPTVGLLYATEHFKGVDISLRAIGIARRSVPELHVRAFGKEPVSRDLPLPEGSEYHRSPAQDTLRDIYGACDVWLCGSRAEGFHLPPSEAMACRCPVVSTRIGGAVEIVEEGVNGFLADVEDAETLGARLATLLSLPEPEWKTMSQAALARVRRYSWDDATDLFERALVDGSDMPAAGAVDQEERKAP